MRYFAILISLCLVGCGALLEATDQDRENKYNAAVSGCGQMQRDPVLWAQCQTEAENLYWGNVSNPDLLSLRQSNHSRTSQPRTGDHAESDRERDQQEASGGPERIGCI
jgi:hypothetical protein